MRDPERKAEARYSPSRPANMGRGFWVIIGLVILAVIVVILVWLLPSATGRLEDGTVEVTPDSSNGSEGNVLPGEPGTSP